MVNHNLKAICGILACVFLIISCDKGGVPNQKGVPEYNAEDLELYTSIVAMDKQFFDAYNQCDLEK